MGHIIDDDAGEVFNASAEGIIAWVRTTRPEPPREVVVAHVRDLVDDDDLLSEADVDKLIAAGYSSCSSSRLGTGVASVPDGPLGPERPPSQREVRTP